MPQPKVIKWKKTTSPQQKHIRKSRNNMKYGTGLCSHDQGNTRARPPPFPNSRLLQQLECTQSFKLTFPSPIPWAKQKRTFGIAYSAFMTKIHNDAFDFFTFTTTFTALFPKQRFRNSRKVSFKTTAILVHKICVSFKRTTWGFENGSLFGERGTHLSGGNFVLLCHQEILGLLR